MAVIGPSAVPKIVMISPGGMGPPTKLAPLVTPPALMVGRGAVTTSVTEMVVDPVEAPLAARVMVPLYVPGFRPLGVTVAWSVAGTVPEEAETPSQLPLLEAVAVNVSP